MIPEASVVVPTYNRAAVLTECLDALTAPVPDTPPFEIIVVDDASDDDTPRVLEARTAGAVHAGFRYVRHEANRGRSATRNTGIRLSQGRIVVLVDDDIIVSPTYVRAHLARHAAAEGEHLAVVGNLSFPEDVLRASNYAKYLQSRYLGHRPTGARRGVDLEDLHPRFLGSGISSVRRDDLEAIGLFDEASRSYGYEDHLFGHRLRARGVRVVFAPEARALHRDTVTLAWYRAKMREAGRDGLPLLREQSPEFLDQTSLVVFSPPDWTHDPRSLLARKLLLRAALNPVTMLLLEAWARATDRVGPMYVPTLYRALSAGWLLQGARMARHGPPLVRYGT
jgi:glycosyltransferase involved in cell wall biosynthesis